MIDPMVPAPLFIPLTISDKSVICWYQHWSIHHTHHLVEIDDPLLLP